MKTKGTKVRLTLDAMMHYSEQGHEWVKQTLVITHVATKHMPSKEFFARGKPEGYHPGYDEGVSPSKLYDLATLDGQEIPCSLYEWELLLA